MKASDKIAKHLGPVIQARFGLAAEPKVTIVTGPGLGTGVRFRASCPGQIDSIECMVPMGVLVKHIDAGGKLIIDHNGINHTVSIPGGLLCTR